MLGDLRFSPGMSVSWLLFSILQSSYTPSGAPASASRVRTTRRALRAENVQPDAVEAVARTGEALQFKFVRTAAS
jgi:hypothetical protein